MPRPFVTLTGVAVLTLMPARAWAHAALVHADPAAGATLTAAPETVVLDFSENVVPRLSSITVEDASGRTVAMGKATGAGAGASLRVTLAPHLQAGRYTVIWRAVAVDTHKTQGRFGFTVKP